MTMSYQKLVWILLLVFFVGGALAIFDASKQTQDTDQQIQDKALNEGPRAVGSNVSFVVTEGEQKKWRITAKEAIYFEDRSGAKLKGVQSQFFNQKGEPVMMIKAPAGEYINKNNQVVLSGGVVAKSPDPEKKMALKAPKMSWSAKTNQVLAEGGVEVKYATGTSKSQRCRFTLDLSTISLEGGVSSTMSY